MTHLQCVNQSDCRWATKRCKGETIHLISYRIELVYVEFYLQHSSASAFIGFGARFLLLASRLVFRMNSLSLCLKSRSYGIECKRSSY